MADTRPFVVSLYLGLARLAVPFYWLLHFIRCRLGKEDPARANEKWGRPNIKRPCGHLVWIHAASVGETNSVLPLIEAMAARGSQVVLTTVTRTSAELAANRLPEGAIHQFVPFDSPSFVSRFLDHWKPDLALTVESEIWPALFVEIRRRTIPFALVNGRMSDKSFRGWLRLRAAATYVFGCLDLALAQTPADMRRLKKLGCKDAVCPGNLKFDARLDDARTPELNDLKEALGDRPVWLAALTHPGEDEIALAAHAELRKTHPDCLLLLVPRHPARADSIEALVDAEGFSAVRRSSGGKPEKGTAVFIGDTLGEMALFYQLAPVSFLGGSFNDVGGHNPVEAATFGAAIICGPKVANARAVYKILWGAKAAQRLETPDELAACVDTLLRDNSARAVQAKKALEIVEGGRGALERTVEYLQPLLRRRLGSDAGKGNP